MSEEMEENNAATQNNLEKQKKKSFPVQSKLNLCRPFLLKWN